MSIIVSIIAVAITMCTGKHVYMYRYNINMLWIFFYTYNTGGTGGTGIIIEIIITHHNKVNNSLP